MTSWSLADEGDLSLYKDTGTVFSETTAPTPNTSFSSERIKLEAVDGTNYNRTYSILRAPAGVEVARISISFEGMHNSPSRAQGGNGSHIYVGLTRTPELPDFDESTIVEGGDFLAWQRGYEPTGNNATFAAGDANLDNVVDELDLIAWRLRYGSSANAGLVTAVPEPVTGVLAIVLMLVGALRRETV